MTPNELVFTFRGLHVCVQFGENRRRNRNATVRVSTDGQTHTHTHGQTQNDFILSHAICYSYGADNEVVVMAMSSSRCACVRVCVQALTFEHKKLSYRGGSA